MLSELRYSQQSIDESDIAAVVKVLRSPWLTQGPEVERFEAALCEYTGARYCVAVSSGTAALHLAYRVARKRRLQTSPLTFVATANAAVMVGMDVCFADVDSGTGNVSLTGFHDCLSVPVHYAGRAAPIPDTGAVVEDAAHALGGNCADCCGKIGNCAHSLATCLSFHAVKSVACGEGGAVLSNVEGFAQEVRELRSHGRSADGECQAVAPNYRLTDIQAALGRSQLLRLDAGVAHRAELAARYTDLLRHVDGVKCPEPMPGGAWHLYTARFDETQRDRILSELKSSGILAQKHYSPPVHLHPAYRKRFGYERAEFPNAEAWAASEISLPLHVGMSDRDVNRVVEALKVAL
jgi:dTDP-4-amino-4,6-dideoxygalactose transaminase